jgi:ABC transport system ATP-binding/permease protein
MSEPILMALVQLFAIIASSGKKSISGSARDMVVSYLQQHLNQLELDEYIKLFDELVLFHTPEKEDLPQQDVTTKITVICQKINLGLQQRDKIIVFVKFLEFLQEIRKIQSPQHPAFGELENKYIETIGTCFKLTEDEFKESLVFILDPFGSSVLKDNLLVIDSIRHEDSVYEKHIYRELLDGLILILHIPSIKTFICRYLGHDDLYLNGHNISPNSCFLFDNGYILKSLKINPVYYSDLAVQFLQTKNNIQVEFTAQEIEFHFRNSHNGIQPFSFTAYSGELIGVMGGSGVGKSTLLNVLNGNLKLSNGRILINGYDISRDKEKLNGSIGFVPQDDLLIEELTVYQNMYYNAKLCFDKYSETKIEHEITRILSEIDLLGIKDMKVGDPLNKFISGGQRKRLNIALELIREPSVLFADEPTSGLSSMDSEMVMFLMKEQTLKGKLVIVNIHQPSSDIFKLFDKLLIMDKGGYPIYYGNPIDALSYFKSISNHVNPGESECLSCGYVNPELILQITEAKTINEYGKHTATRKISPKEWYDHFRKNIQPGFKIRNDKKPLPCCFFEIPNRFKQFIIFSNRNLFSKITNRQYMIINLVEAPFLAALLAFLIRFPNSSKYVFANNQNLVAYLFMSVVVALFLGMMVSAEEIIRDRRILKREAFLHLSKGSYLNSKIVLLFALSAVQTFLYVLIGNWILGIHGMWLNYWLILFATSCCANMIGLNISAGLNSVVAIYILIPFIIVPQLLLSGTVVPFDKLNHTISSDENVPLIGDIMVSRWSFEALAVDQFKSNSYEKIFYPFDKEISRYSYYTAVLIPQLQSMTDECNRNIILKKDPAETSRKLTLIRQEIDQLRNQAKFSSFPLSAKFTVSSFSFDAASGTSLYLDSLSKTFSGIMTDLTQIRDSKYEDLVRNLGEDGAYKFKQKYYNENLADLVLNKSFENKILETGTKLIRKKDPVFMEPESRIGRAHFYSPVKNIFGWKMDTFWFNFCVLWLMSGILYLTLLGDSVRKVITYFESVRFKKRQ